jgi:hypothetical protein
VNPAALSKKGIVMRMWKFLLGTLLLALFFGVAISPHLPEPVKAGPVCDYDDFCDSTADCVQEICCRQETCQGKPIKRFLVNNEWHNCHPSGRCIFSVSCVYDCDPT